MSKLIYLSIGIAIAYFLVGHFAFSGDDFNLATPDINVGLIQDTQDLVDDLNTRLNLKPSVTSVAPVVNELNYKNYSKKEVENFNGSIVLDFHAPWCPYCVVLEADIKRNIKNIPADILILKVDYDSATDLRKKYGVSVQHTFVQVDNAGRGLKKWSGGNSLKHLLSNVSR